jgi:DNA-binding GntR family transcriptional regulator
MHYGLGGVCMIRVGYSGESGAANSLGTRVFKQLQNDIINGEYQPGDYLTETKLSEELGVSRTPIREALKQLELEGLVKSTPGRGVTVQGISTKDIEDIYTIRMMIEGLAARWATEKITSKARTIEFIPPTVKYVPTQIKAIITICIGVLINK